MISRISGLLRDMVLAGSFGASPLLDWFLVATRIPNLFRDMLAEGALGGAFTKVYSGTYPSDPQRADQLLRDMLRLALLGSIIFCGLGILVAPWLVDLMTLVSQRHGSDPQMIATITSLTRLLFPYLGLTILGAIVAGALHQHNRFFLTAVSPIALNLGYILGATVIAHAFVAALPPEFATSFADRAITGLAIGVLLGGFGHLYIQIRGLHKLGISNLFMRSWQKCWTPDTKHVLRLMLPATIAASTGPINLFISTNFAISAGPGSVSWLYYAFHVLHLPVGVFGVAVGSAALPALSRAVVKNTGTINAEVARQLQFAMELVLWLMVPSFLVFILSATDIVTVLFQHGDFDTESTVATSAALRAYSFSLFGYGLLKVLTSFYYASERTSFAMKTGLISIILNTIGCWLLVERYGHIGLAMTSSITICANAVFLLIGLTPQKPAFNWREILKMLAFLSAGLCLCLLLGKGLEYSSMLSILTATMPIKISSLITVLANGLIITSVFFMLAVWRFDITANQLWQRLKKRR